MNALHKNDTLSRFEREGELYKFLWEDVKRLKVSAAVSVLLVVGGSALYAFHSDVSQSVAVAIGLAGTYAAFMVALAVFRWARRDSAKTRSHILEIAEFAKKATGTERPEDDEDIEDPDPLATGIDLQSMQVGNVRYVFVPRPYQHDMAWWQRLLTRVDEAAQGGESAEIARELLQTPIDEVLAVGFPEQKQRGNRRTLLLTESNGERLVWSVFSGKGKRVEKL